MPDEPWKQATILLVDDQEATSACSSGCCRTPAMPPSSAPPIRCEAVDLYLQYRPDLVVLDLHMPQLDGLGVLERLSTHMPSGTYVRC